MRKSVLGRNRVFPASLLLGLLAAAPVGAAPFAYVANFGNPPSVSVIDLATEAVVTTIPAPDGTDPYWVAISRNGSVVAVTLHDDTGVLLIDATTNSSLGVVGGVGEEPEAVAVNSTGTTVYVADEQPSSTEGELYVVDVATRSVTAGPIRIDELEGMEICDEPENMVISPDDRFLYIACAGDTVIRVDTSTFSILPIADDTDDAHGVALSCDGTRLYYGDTSVPDEGAQAFEWNTQTQALTGTVFDDCELYNGAVSPDGSQLYCVEENRSVKIYDTASGNLLKEIDFGSCCSAGVAVHPLGGKIYVPVSSQDRVEVVDTVALQDLPGSISVGDNPERGIAIQSCTVPANRVPVAGHTGLAVLCLLLAALGSSCLYLRHV